MPASAGLPRPSSQRPLPFEARKDLSIQQVRYGAQQYWVLKDPLRNELFRLRADQYAVHQLLDGHRSLEDIRACLTSEFRDLSITLSQVQELVIDLFRRGLVWSTRPGQAEPLAQRQRESRRLRLLGALQNPLFIRLPGWDPQWFLNAAYPRVKGLFRPAAVAAGALLVAATWAVVILQIDEFHARVPTFQDLAHGRSLMMMWAVVAAVKVLHELGHALACRHFGGECHEIGVALMMLSPSMYCDVSDAGRLASRWPRIAVGAAGMCVELVISSLAFFLWWFTRDGALHDLCLAIFLVANISVIALNLNPLLRLDGYFMLSDWLGVPNLRQKADLLAGRFFARLCLGVRSPEDPSLPQSRRWLFVCYAIASTLFRWQLTVIITVVLYKALKPYGLQAAGLLAGSAIFVAAMARGIRSAARAWREARERRTPRWRPRIACGVLALMAVAALTVPFPVLVTAPLIVEPVDGQQVYVSTPGRLMSVRVRPGQRVRRGEILAELENRDLLDAYRQVQTSYDLQCLAVKMHQATGDSAQEVLAREIRDSLEEEVRDCRDRLTQLQIPAPCDGVVICPPGPIGSRRSSDRADRMPLDPSNLGSYLPVGTHLLTVAPSPDFQAVLLVDQSSSPSFAPGVKVRLKLEHAPDKVIHGLVTSRSIPDQSYGAPDDSFAREKVAASHAPAGGGTPRLSQATVPLTELNAPVVAGLRGEARVIVFHPSLASWLWRQAHQTFRFL